jgi:hypothetical protein
MDALRKLEDGYNEIRSSMGLFDEQFHKVDSLEQHMTEILALLRTRAAGDEKVFSAVPKQEEPRPQAADSAFSSPEQARGEISSGHLNSVDTSTIEETPSGISIHVDHTVAAHRLLNWRVVRELLAGKAPNENYVMEHEERKGLLRIYGKGQGRDTYDGAQSGTPSSPASSASGEDAGRSPNNNPSIDDAYWGDHDLGLPNMVDGKFFYNDHVHLGGLTANGALKLDRTTMFELMDSYLENIHILHPFLDKGRLRRMVEKVCQDYNPNDPVFTRSPFMHNAQHPPHSRPLKRKHSSGDSPSDAGTPTNTNRISSEPRLARRISTAIVLLVMALGKICQYTDPLPGFAGDFSRDPSSGMFNSSPYPALSPSTSVSSPLSASEMRGVSGVSRGSAVDSVRRKMRKGDRNVDVIPGLAYFAKATDILGGLQGNDLPFVQANLLAAVYTAQFACVFESWTWIHHACRVCGFLVRDPTFEKEKKDPKRVDLIRFAYLTCLQLESDILAEFDLRPSGLQNIDPGNRIERPRGVVEDAQEISQRETSGSDLIMVYYNYQLSLRKLMNDWQSFLYPPNVNESLERIFKVENDKLSMNDRNSCEEMLTYFRGMIQANPLVRWKDEDPPSSDINAARLRGKYYGAKYIIHRPFLYYALHHFDDRDITPEVRRRFAQYQAKPDAFPLENSPPKGATKEERSTWLVFQMLISCHQCVKAAKSSTTAFDGVLKNKRLMVTNIFGTAHA